MRERHLPGPRRIAAADQPRGRDRVVRRAERSTAGDRRFDRQPACARDAGGVDPLRRIERRQDRRQPPRRHRLAGSRRAADQQAVAARRRKLERVAQRGLSAEVGEVRAGRRSRSAGPPAGTVAVPRNRRAGPAGRVDRSRSPSPRPPARPPARTQTGRRSHVHHRARRPRPSRACLAPAAASRRAQARPPARGRRAAAGTIWSVAASTAAASARSKPGPALRRSAGARFAVIRRCGNSKPLLTIAARTRSRDSRTAASGRPTSANDGSPRRTSASTRTSRASTPSRLKVRAIASIGRP